tara:strand:- start:7323 stop:7643 length:321 start_codon:yes stop_codon:yes gene_type:complete
VGVVLSGNLRIQFGRHSVRVHGESSRLIADFPSLGSIMQFRKGLPDVPDHGGDPMARLTEHLDLTVRIRKRRVATITARDGRLTIHRHWPAILLSLLPRGGTNNDR